MFRLFPPPPPGPDVLPGLDGPGAWGASDAGVSQVVEGVVGDVVCPDVIPDLRQRPVGERVQFEDAPMGLIALDLWDRDARHRLLPAQAGDPCFESPERPPQGLHLADPATELSLLHAPSEGVESFLSLQGLDRLAVGKVALDGNAVPVPNALHDLVRLFVEASRVESEHADRGVDPPRHVQDHHIFRLQTRGKGDVRVKPIQAPPEHRFGILLLQLRLQFLDFPLRHQASALHRRPLYPFHRRHPFLPSCIALFHLPGGQAARYSTVARIMGPSLNTSGMTSTGTTCSSMARRVGGPTATTRARSFSDRPRSSSNPCAAAKEKRFRADGGLVNVITSIFPWPRSWISSRIRSSSGGRNLKPTAARTAAPRSSSSSEYRYVTAS